MESAAPIQREKLFAPFGPLERVLTVAALLGSLAWAWHSGIVANLMLLALDRASLSRHQSTQGAGAIVVLGGRIDRAAKAAELHKGSGIPLYSAGTDVAGALRGEYFVQPRWVDPISTDTETNAAVAACVLFKRRVRSIALVTDGFHMARARLWFTYYGFEVKPVRSRFPHELDPSRWWETPRSAEQVRARKRDAMHEWGGIVEFWVARLTRERLSCGPDGKVRSLAAPGKTPGRREALAGGTRGRPLVE